MIEMRQLFDRISCTYTYLVYEAVTKEALIIDPVDTCHDRDYKLIQELDLNLRYIFDTHVHADHITGAALLKAKTQADYLLGTCTKLEAADRLLEHQDILNLGAHELEVLCTPGHTSGCTSLYGAGMVFTGDSLFIRGCGRTDFQNGSAAELFHSIKEVLYQLPDITRVYPGHNYEGLLLTTIGEEKKYNPRIPKDQTVLAFQKIMDTLNLDRPKLIDISVPANLVGGAKKA